MDGSTASLVCALGWVLVAGCVHRSIDHDADAGRTVTRWCAADGTLLRIRVDQQLPPRDNCEVTERFELELDAASEPIQRVRQVRVCEAIEHELRETRVDGDRWLRVELWDLDHDGRLDYAVDQRPEVEQTGALR